MDLLVSSAIFVEDSSDTQDELFLSDDSSLSPSSYNQAGKKTKKKVKATKKSKEKKAPKKNESEFSGLGDVADLEPEDLKKPVEIERVLTLEVADKLIFWYGRLGHPNQKDMRRLVATKLPPSCGITVEDVDLLPWIIRGSMLNTQKMHEIISELEGATEKGNYRGDFESDDDM